MRLKHIYYRTNSDTVSEWNCDTCDTSWRLERSNITTGPRSGFAWLNPPFRARFRIWKRRLASNRLMHECFRGGLKTPHIVQEAVNEATLLSLVSCRMGVAFVSGATRWRCPESVALLRVTDLKLALPFGLVWRKDNASALLAKFVADVRSLPEVNAFANG
jgi:DNA-binding transcriptional LysR family regulator